MKNNIEKLTKKLTNKELYDLFKKIRSTINDTPAA